MSAARSYAVTLTLNADGSSAVAGVKVVEQAVDRLAEAADEAAGAVKGVTGGTGAAGAAMASAAQRAAALAGATDGAGAAALGAAAGARTLASGAGAAALGLTGAATAAGMFAVSAVKTAEAAAALDRRLIMLTGTGAALAETKAWLAESANRLGKSLPELADGYARLNPMMRSGLLTTGQARDLTLGLIDAQIAFGASADSMGNVLYGLSQALSAPIVHMEELNQVVEPLPGLLADLDKAAGLPAGGFRKLVAEGKATDAMFRDTLVKALKTYEGTAAEAAKGFEGASTRMAEAWRALNEEIGKSAAPGLTAITDAGGGALDWIKRQFVAVKEYNAEGDLARLKLWAQELAQKRDAALAEAFRVADGVGGVYAERNRQMAGKALAGIEQEIAETEAAIIDLEKRLGQADRSLTGALNAAVGKTGAQAGTARTAADELRGAWVAAAEAAGLQTNAIGGLTNSQDDLTRHTNALAKVAALPPEELKKLGITAADVARVVVKLTEAIDPVTAAIKRLNDETGAINAGKFKDLRELMSAARPMQGRPTSDDQGTGDLVDAWARNRKTSAEEQVRLAREAAKASRELADAQATGEPKIIAFAQAAADTKKALAEGIIRPAEEADYYAAKLDEQMAHLAGSMGAAAAEYDKSADVQILAAKRLAEAQLQGADAVREAEIVNRAATEADKERVALDSARGQAILAKVRAEEKWKQAAGDNAALRAANDNLSDLKAEIALMGQSEAVRDRAIKSIQIQREALSQFKTTTSDAAREWIRLQEEIADNQAIKKFNDEVNQVSKDISKDVATAMFEGFSGSETNIMDWFRKLLKRMVIEIISQKFVMPIVTQVVGSVPGLFGISGPTTGAQAAAAAAGQGGGLGGLGGLINTGISKAGGWVMDQLGITGGMSGIMDATMLTVPAGWASPTIATTAASINAAPIGVSSIAEAGAAAGGVTLSGVLGSAGIGALGGTLGGMIGTATGSKAIGALSGAALGGGGAYLASIMGMSAVGGPIGIAIGAIVGGVMAALGSKNKNGDIPAASGQATFDGGKITSTRSDTDNKGDPQLAAQIADATGGFIAGVFKAGGLTDYHPVNFGVETKKGQFKYMVGGKNSGDYGSLDEALIAGLRAAATDTHGGAMFGGDAKVMQAIERSKATKVEDFVKDVDLAKNYDRTLARLSGGAGATSAALDEMRKAAEELGKQGREQILDWRDKVVELGFAAEKDLTAPLLTAVKAMAGLTVVEEPLVGLAAVAERSRLNFLALQPTLAALGQTAEQQAAIAAEMQAKAKAAWDASIGLTKRQADVKLALAGGDDKARLSYADIFDAAGYDRARVGVQALVDTFEDVRRAADAGATSGAAYVAARSQIDALLTSGRVSAEQYGQMIELLAAEMTRGGEAAKAAAQAQADAAKAAAETAAAVSDLRVKALSSAGLGDFGARLAQDLSQAKELADWTAAGRDTGLLKLLQGVDDASLIASQDKAKLIAGYQRDEQAVQTAINARQNEVTAINAARQALVSMAQSAQDARNRIWTDERLSSLGNVDRADKADELLRQYFAQAVDGGASAEARSLAYQRFSALIDPALTAKRQQSGDWGSYDAYLREIDAMLGQLGAGGELAGAVTDAGDSQLDALQRQLSELQRAREAAERGTVQVVGSITELSRIAAGSAATLAALQAQLAADARVTPDAGGAKAAVEMAAAGRGSLWSALGGGGLSDAQRLTDDRWGQSTEALQGGLARVTDADWLATQMRAATANGASPLAAMFAQRLQDLTKRGDGEEASAAAKYYIGMVNGEWDRRIAGGATAETIKADPMYAKLLALQGGAIAGIDDIAMLRDMAAANDWTGDADSTAVERQIAQRLMQLTRQAAGFSQGGITAGGVAGRDSALALVMPDEGILNVAAARRIGHDAVHALNAGAALVDMAPVVAGLDAVGARVSAAVTAGARQTAAAVEAMGRKIDAMSAEIADLRRENQRLSSALSRRAS